MSRRVQAVWRPALTATLVAEAALFLVTRSGYRPWTVVLDWHAFHPHHPLQFYLPWLATLPLVAGAAALWSRRRGASSRQAAVGALFPAIAALGLIVVATPVDILVDVIILNNHALEHTLCGTAWALVSFVLASGLALALGLLLTVVWWHHTQRAAERADQLAAGRV